MGCTTVPSTIVPWQNRGIYPSDRAIYLMDLLYKTRFMHLYYSYSRPLRKAILEHIYCFARYRAPLLHSHLLHRHRHRHRHRCDHRHPHRRCRCRCNITPWLLTHNNATPMHLLSMVMAMAVGGDRMRSHRNNCNNFVTCRGYSGRQRRGRGRGRRLPRQQQHRRRRRLRRRRRRRICENPSSD